MPTESERNAPASVDPWPAWVHALGAAVWVCDPSGRIAFVNPRARSLLGLAADPSGTPCHQVIRGTCAGGAALCRPECAARRSASSGRELEPIVVCAGDVRARRRWLLVFHIPLPCSTAPAPWMVHVACDVEHYQRTDEYVRRLAARSGARSRAGLDALLTRRELEILGWLARDEPAKRVAFLLGVSPTTVRNHVRNLLARLDVHSIQEAIALYLLDGADDREPGSSPAPIPAVPRSLAREVGELRPVRGGRTPRRLRR